MKRPNRYLPPSRKKQKATPVAAMPVASSSIFDTWLQRASQLAQVSLVVITGFTIYYTVIPLYGKALVDEQIARKEIELQRVSDSLDKLYVSARRYAVETLVHRLAFQCISGPPDALMRPPGEPFDAEWKRQRLNLDRGACLSKTIDESPEMMAVLRPHDAAFFRSSARDLGMRLEQTREVARSEFASAPIEAKRNPSNFIDHESYTVRVIDELRFQASEQQYQVWLLEQATSRAQEAAIGKLTNAASDGIQKLRDLAWPDPPAKD